MPFSRPTASSRIRADVTREELSQKEPPAAKVPRSASGTAPPPQSRQLFTPPQPDDAHVAPRVDSGRHPRLDASLPRHARGRAPATAPPSPSLQAFTAQCDSVMRRAQELLERTRDQEALVAKVLEQRLSQSPVRRANSQSGSQSDGHTPVHGGDRGSWFRRSASPSLPQAPHTTPVPSLAQMQEQQRASAAAAGTTSPSPGRRSGGLFAFLSPHRPSMPPPPPPTPATAAHAGPPSPTPTAATPQRPSLYERVRHSLQRLSGTLPAAPAPSPVPQPHPQPRQPPEDGTGAATSVSLARKSVRFVSPDKLESVTPAQRCAGSAEEGTARDDAEQPAKAEGLHVTFEDAVTGVAAAEVRRRSPSDRSTKASPKRSRSGSTRASPSPARKSARGGDATPAAPEKVEELLGCGSAARGKDGQGEGASPPHASRSRSSSASTSSAVRERHLEMVAFIQSNTVKRSLAAFTKAELLECLRAEGVPMASPDATKKKLLDELRGLLAAK